MREKAKRLKSKISALFLAYKRKDTPILAKIVTAVTVFYALSPIDFIPDFIPILGYLDDIILLPLLVLLCIRLIPERIMAECEQEAADLWKNGKPKKWYYAVPIILCWVFFIIILLKYLIF